MRPVSRLRPNPPSRAKRNIRWAAITLLALSLAPAASPERATPDEDATLAAETESTQIGGTPWNEETPRIADGGVIDSALDHGADSIPLE